VRTLNERGNRENSFINNIESLYPDFLFDGEIYMLTYFKYIPTNQQQSVLAILPFIRAGSFTCSFHNGDDRISIDDIDWSFVKDWAERHRFVPILYHHLIQSDLIDCLPASTAESLRLQYLQIVSKNVWLDKQLKLILNLLHDIPAIPFKGPVLAQSLYENSYLRFYRDLDILVPEEKAVAAWQRLKQSGFIEPECQLTIEQFKQYIKYEREFDFTDTAGRVWVDLHWQLGANMRASFNYNVCKDRLIIITVNRQKICCLSHEDTLVHLCINGAYDIWNHLESILCLAEHIDQHPDLRWELVLNLANVLQCRRMIFLGLFLARDLFEIQLPQKIVDLIENDKVIIRLAGIIYQGMFHELSANNSFQQQLIEIPFQLKIREKTMDKVLYLLHRLLKPTKKDWRNLPLPPKLAFFYFFLRPIALGMEWIREK
jgi:hypothetical protein